MPCLFFPPRFDQKIRFGYLPSMFQRKGQGHWFQQIPLSLYPFNNNKNDVAAAAAAADAVTVLKLLV